jgi:radical SAM superfamily enzyme YgiQ (UPF0313 family)
MKFNRILLTRPPTGSNALQGGDDRDPYPQPALGLAYIAAALEDCIEVLPILDGNFTDDYLRALRDTVSEQKPDIVGFSAFTPFARKAMDGCRVVKEVDSSILTVMGGPHATVLPEKTLLHCPELDLIVRDEGETTVQEIVEGRSLRDIPGLVLRNDGHIVMTPPRGYIDDMDKIPFPAYHMLPEFPRGYKPHPPKSTGAVWASAMWSRGCPFTCTYCTRDASFGLNFRCNTPEYVVRLLRHLHDDYGVEELTFYDDVFTLHRAKTLKLLEAMRPENLGFELVWDCETRVDLVDPEVLRAMRAAGCRMIAYGIEHGRWIKEIKGGKASIEQAEKAVRWTHEAGIDTVGYFMIGLPGETRATVRETIRFAKRLDVTWAQFAITTPFPGNELYRQAVAAGLVDLDEMWDKYLYASLGKIEAPPLLTTTDLSAKDLEYWSRRAYRSFYVRPRFVARRLTHARDLRTVRMYWTGFKTLWSMLVSS